MSIKARVDSIYRKLNPSGLTQEWMAFIREADAACQRLDPYHVPLSERELLLAAKDGARSGKKPGDALAEMLTGLYEGRC